MSENYKYFENKQCEYYPCHKDVSDFNCMFCYCPMYTFEKCLGNPQYLENGEKKIKDCSMCSYPHKQENYESIIEFISNR